MKGRKPDFFIPRGNYELNEMIPIKVDNIFGFRKTFCTVSNFFQISFISVGGEEISWDFKSEEERDNTFQTILQQYTKLI